MGKVFRETSRPSSSSSCPASSSPPTTTSTSITETVNGTHHFKITGYSLSKGIGIGKYIASDTFNVGGYSWAIYFYPDGKSVEDNAAYVSLFIALASEGTDVRALFELTLLDQSGNERHKVHSHFGRTLDSGPYTLKYRGSMWWVGEFPVLDFVFVGILVFLPSVLMKVYEFVNVGNLGFPFSKRSMLLLFDLFLFRCNVYI